MKNHINRIRFISKLVLLFVFVLSASVVSAKKTNVVLLFSDDAGYHDFGFQGSKTFQTPHLDKLANEGVVFKNAYVTAAVCGPSRAGLLTGRYQQRFGVEENNVPGYMSASSKLMGDEMGMPLDEKTIADYMGKLGYQSVIFGKWHLGNADRYHPLKRGFNEFYGFRGGARSFWSLTQEEAAQKPEDRWEKGFGVYKEPEKYLTDAIADQACDFMERHKNSPFFMYVSFNAVHTPLQATPEDLKAVEGLGLSGKRKILAAMNVAMDRACGQILEKLEELGLEENTLVVFANDNGGPDVSETCNYPLSGCKATHLEGGLRVPFVMKMPGKIKEGSTYEAPISTLDLLPTFVNIAGGDAKKIKDIDGVDLMPFLMGTNDGIPHEVLYWKKENRGTIRMGDWKMLRFPDRPAELYNLSEDIGEKNNLAYEHPDKVRELFKQLWSWECELERPLFMLDRLYEEKAMIRTDEKRDPVLDELNKE